MRRTSLGTKLGELPPRSSLIPSKLLLLPVNVQELINSHTVLPEALEKWEVSLFEKLLPRHLQIIYKINFEFLGQVAQRWPHDTARIERMSIIQEGNPKYVRMAFLAIVGSFKVNGVAQLHSQLLQATIFKDFVEFKGRDFFTNVTNGVTPRR
jgi:starch phosphorylase